MGSGLGWKGGGTPGFSPAEIRDAARQPRDAVHVVVDPSVGTIGVARGGEVCPTTDGATWPLLGVLPPLYPEWLGDRSFAEVHGTRFPYVAGAMANGISTTRLVIEMAKHGYIGFFGAGGLGLPSVEAAIDELCSVLGVDGQPWGTNLIHSPLEPALEDAVADLYIRRGVRRVSASAYMKLTPAIVRYALSGLDSGPDGRIVRTAHVFAKISRPEVAAQFMSPAPPDIVGYLLDHALVTEEQARLAAAVPIAEDITVEADSGGHTDNRPLGALFPTIAETRRGIVAEYGFDSPIRLGAAGGLGTPLSVASAFGLGAAYVLTGSVNESCVESGLHQNGRHLLAEAELADVMMAPAADMFELGVELQVLKRGTMFGPRARKLHDIYRRHASLDDIQPDERAKLEQQILGMSLEDCWEATKQFWSDRDPDEIARAEADPKHRMALVFRSYLGLSSRWAIDGHPDRCLDYQIWCGPAMGAFNAWVRGSFLDDPDSRTVVQVANNLLEGAAVVTRANQLRSYGVAVPESAYDFRPRPLS